MTVWNAIRDATPWQVRLFSRQVKRTIRQAREARMTCRDIFTEIYERGEWGSAEGTEFYSGPGSDPAVARPYAEAVARFVAEHGIGSVIDIGCGDFRVGRMIADGGVRYTGVDIVDGLVARNQASFGAPGVSFATGNVVEDDLPDAGLCLVREVFQHLSNREIQAALGRLRKYPYVIVTDHQPAGTRFVGNRDKPHGRDIRVFSRSALVLDQPPFSLPDVSLFLDLPSPNVLFDAGERLRSFLIVNAPARGHAPAAPAGGGWRRYWTAE